MFNYKKSLLSIAAVTALSVSTLSAGYIPLTGSGGEEEQWVLFGVTGLKTTGAGAGTSAGAFSVSSGTANTITDATQDDLFTEGLLASTGESLGKVKVLAPYSQVEVRVDTTGAVYNETEPVRTMYVTLIDGGSPSFALTYRSSLEGLTLQYSTNTDGSDARTLTINSENTYNNPAYGEVIQEVAGVPGSTLNALTDLVDYDFTDNPTDSSYYDETTDQQLAAAGEYLRVYSYDASISQWGLYDSRNTVTANNFTTLEKGKAYWAKMNGAGAAKIGGLVLGSSTISATDYQTAGVTDGWNLLAFDSANPDIRKSTTGLMITIAGAGNLIISDASGNHSATAAILGVTVVADCAIINNAIKTAKDNGLFPENFDLTAYPGGAGDLILLANKRFMIADGTAGAGGVVSLVTTLAGEVPYLVTDATNPIDASDSLSTATLADLGVTTGPLGTELVAMSKYGEYSMAIEPLVGGTDAAALGIGSIHVQSAASDAVANPITDMGTDASIANSVASLNGATTDYDIGGYTATFSEIDTDLDGTTDKVFIASTEPFYVRDHTFTRVFKYTAALADNTITLDGLVADGDVLLTTAVEVDASTAAAKIDSAVSGYSVEADDDAAGNIVIITDDANGNEFTVIEDTVEDRLEDATTTVDLAKGAVKGVYSTGNLASAPLLNKLTMTDATTDVLTQDDILDTVQISITTAAGVVQDTATVVTAAAIADDAGFAVFLKAQIEALLAAESISYTSVTVTPATAAAVNVVLVSSEVTTFDVDTVDGSASGPGNATYTPDILLLSVPSVTADLADDLKYNAVYTPNYVVDGPLYSMKETSFTLKALVTGTTDISDGSVNWDSVDLTRTPSDWLDSQDYNLFNINEASGYWAFVETDGGTNGLGVSNAQLNPLVYTYRFNAVSSTTKLGTNYSSVSGNMALTIDGLDTDTRAIPVVSVTLAGSEIELANIAGTNSYTGKASSHEIEDMITGYNYEILANIADGLGYNLRSHDIGLTIDMVKPATPSIDLGDGTAVTFASTSTDVAGFYVFNGQIPEANTLGASNLLANLTVAEANGYALCAETTKLTWLKPAYDLNVIAVDGTGVLGGGNASDTFSKNFVPMLKSAVLIEDTRNGTITDTSDGTIYGADCLSAGTVGAVNTYGMSISSVLELATVRMAYEPISITGTATAISLFVNDASKDATVVAEIKYDPAYATKTVYVELAGRVYSLVLPTLAELVGDDSAGAIGTTLSQYGAAGVGQTTASPLNLDDGSVDWDLATGAQAVGSTGYAEFQADQSLTSTP